ncbi:hypothetical protein QBC39DRAFT_335966 [Podospora conica]|nr:hypothetical protein QBC39DRAFT_335966 [Schizothecium conicum]
MGSRHRNSVRKSRSFCSVSPPGTNWLGGRRRLLSVAQRSLLAGDMRARGPLFWRGFCRRNKQHDNTTEVQIPRKTATSPYPPWTSRSACGSCSAVSDADLALDPACQAVGGGELLVVKRALARSDSCNAPGPRNHHPLGPAGRSSCPSRCCSPFFSGTLDPPVEFSRPPPRFHHHRSWSRGFMPRCGCRARTIGVNRPMVVHTYLGRYEF